MSSETYLRRTLFEQIGFTVTPDEAIDEQLLWHQGIEAKRSGRFSEAVQYFARLVGNDPFSGEYWMALAASLHEEDRHEKALVCYAMSALLDESNPAPHFHAAQIFFLRGERSDFEKSIELARARSMLSSQYRPILEKIDILMAHVDKRWGKYGLRTS